MPEITKLAWLFAKERKMKFIALEHHPNDSRIKISEDGICQSLTSRMGTGGNNVPLVLCFSEQRRAQSKDDFETWVESDMANTLNAFDLGDIRTTTIVVTDEAENSNGEEIRRISRRR